MIIVNNISNFIAVNNMLNDDDYLLRQSMIGDNSDDTINSDGILNVSHYPHYKGEILEDPTMIFPPLHL